MIKVDENTCIGCGACMAIAPETFDFNEAGLSTVVSEEITDSAKEAVGACPVGAISITEATATPVAETEESKVIEFPVAEEETEEKAA